MLLLLKQTLKTPPKPFTQLFAEQLANIRGKDQHVNKLLGGPRHFKGITGWLSAKGSKKNQGQGNRAPDPAAQSSKL